MFLLLCYIHIYLIWILSLPNCIWKLYSQVYHYISGLRLEAAYLFWLTRQRSLLSMFQCFNPFFGSETSVSISEREKLWELVKLSSLRRDGSFGSNWLSPQSYISSPLGPGSWLLLYHISILYGPSKSWLPLGLAWLWLGRSRIQERVSEKKREKPRRNLATTYLKDFDPQGEPEADAWAWDPSPSFLSLREKTRA
jgi:hypothetical protein